MRIAVLYHNDADGFGAAYACWLKFKDSAIYVPVQYNQPVPPLPDTIKELYIVDFSYSREICIDLALEYHLTIIDHHTTAEEALADLNFAVFDKELSGAVLTWQHMHNSRPVPDILRYVQDRDLWKFELHMSKEVNAYIATMPQEFGVWDQFALYAAKVEGGAILRFQAEQIKRRLADVVIIQMSADDGYAFKRSDGTYLISRSASISDSDCIKYLIPIVNASDNISELGEAMCFDYPESLFSISYCDRADGKRSYSLRSRFGFDVSEVAKAFGGGGHKAAAGFTLDAPNII